jgi:hypothetical protein
MFRLIALTLVVAAAWLAAPTSASATTILETWPKLQFPRTTDSNRGCESRAVRTGPGKYRWRVFTAYSFAENQRQWKSGVIRLPRDLYSWQICWYPKGSKVASYSTIGHYAGPSHERRLNAFIIDGNFGSGQYHVGSTLDRIRR